MQRTSAIEILTSMSESRLQLNVRVSLNLFYFNNLFLEGLMTNFDI